MKKSILTLSVLISLTACDGDDQGDSLIPTTTQEVEQVTSSYDGWYMVIIDVSSGDCYSPGVLEFEIINGEVFSLDERTELVGEVRGNKLEGTGIFLDTGDIVTFSGEVYDNGGAIGAWTNTDAGCAGTFG